MILVCHPLLKNTKISAITLFPFILLRNRSDRQNKILLNHEKIHLRQQAELFILFFYLWYVIEYYVRVIQLKDRFLAYQMISFEREAYANEADLGYLERRKFWGFLKFV